MKDEVWKSIPSYEGSYEVSNLGRVRSVDVIRRNKQGTCVRRGKVLAQSLSTKGGYLRLQLNVLGVYRAHEVHQLVAAAFLGPRPSRFDTDHKDGDPTNNRADNLQYIPRQVNTQKGRTAALTPLDIPVIRARLAQGDLVKRIAADYGVASGTISFIKAGATWRNVA